MSTDYSQWQPIEHTGEPGDQQKDLDAGYWAELGPEDGHGPRAWSWTVLSGEDGVKVDFAESEEAAKAAVDAWAAANIPGWPGSSPAAT